MKKMMTIAALVFLAACAQTPANPVEVQPMSLNKLTIFRPTSETSYVVSYDVAGYGVGHLSVAANSASKLQSCIDYVAGIAEVASSSGTNSTVAEVKSLEVKSLCHGSIITAELRPYSRDVVTIRFNLLRLDALQPVNVNGMEVQMPVTSNLNLANEINLLPGQTVTISPTGVVISAL